MPDRDRWWPITEDQVAWRAGALCYAALGPHLTHRLLATLEDTPDHTIEDPTVILLREQLREVDGRPPTMLLLLASAMAVLQKALFGEPIPPRAEDDRYGPLLDKRDEAYKFLGDLTIQAVQQFGWNERAFLEYCQGEWSFVMEPSWPPAGAAYTRQPPHATPVRRAPSDFDFWHSLRPDPSLIGAHLVRLEDLTRYVAELEAALANARRDVQAEDGFEPQSAAETGETVRHLTEAVAQIRRAEQLIRQAQDVIVRVFPT